MEEKNLESFNFRGLNNVLLQSNPCQLFSGLDKSSF